MEKTLGWGETVCHSEQSESEDPESSLACHCEEHRVWRGRRGNPGITVPIKAVEANLPQYGHFQAAPQGCTGSILNAEAARVTIQNQ